METRRGHFIISTFPHRLDIGVIHAYLSEESYWAEEIPRDIVEESIKHSLCFGLYLDERQVGFARVITDRATFAYLCDVFVIKEFQGQGLGTWLVETVMAHPDLQGLRRFLLATRDAHGLYSKVGFKPLASPERIMEIRVPDIYRRNSDAV